MDEKDIKVGKSYPYRSKGNAGTGKVTGKEHKRTGWWVTLHDEARKRVVTVRPSQVGAAS